MIFFFSISVRLLLSAVIKNFVPIDFDCRAKVNTLLPTYNFFSDYSAGFSAGHHWSRGFSASFVWGVCRFSCKKGLYAGPHRWKPVQRPWSISVDKIGCFPSSCLRSDDFVQELRNLHLFATDRCDFLASFFRQGKVHLSFVCRAKDAGNQSFLLDRGDDFRRVRWGQSQ